MSKPERKLAIGICPMIYSDISHNVVKTVFSKMPTLLLPSFSTIAETIANTAKKLAFTVRKTKVEFTEKVAIYVYPYFAYGKCNVVCEFSHR